MNRPKPLYVSTAYQIGLLNNENIPNLIPCLLTNKYNAYSARFLKQWILNPPTHEMANHMRSLCNQLSVSKLPLPRFNPISTGKVITFLDAAECNSALFRDIRLNVYNLFNMLQNDKYSEFNNQLLPLTSFVSGIATSREILQQRSKHIADCIDKIIFFDNYEDAPFVDPYGRIPDEFFQRNEEEFRGKVLKAANPIVQNLYEEILQLSISLSEIIKKEYDENYVVVMDKINNNLYFEKKKTKRQLDDVTNNNNNIEYIPYVIEKDKKSYKKRLSLKEKEKLEDLK